MMITDVENVHETQYQGKLPIEKLLTIETLRTIEKLLLTLIDREREYSF